MLIHFYTKKNTFDVKIQPYNIGLQGLDIIDTYTNSIVEMHFYLI